MGPKPEEILKAIEAVLSVPAGVPCIVPSADWEGWEDVLSILGLQGGNRMVAALRDAVVKELGHPDPYETRTADRQNILHGQKLVHDPISRGMGSKIVADTRLGAGRSGAVMYQVSTSGSDGNEAFAWVTEDALRSTFEGAADRMLDLWRAHNGTTKPLVDLSTARPMDPEVLMGWSRLAAVRPPTDRALPPAPGALEPSVQGAQAASIQAAPWAAGPAVHQEAGSQVGSGLPEAANTGLQQEASPANHRHSPREERQGALHKEPGSHQLQPQQQPEQQPEQTEQQPQQPEHQPQQPEHQPQQQPEHQPEQTEQQPQQPEHQPQQQPEQTEQQLQQPEQQPQQPEHQPQQQPRQPEQPEQQPQRLRSPPIHEDNEDPNSSYCDADAKAAVLHAYEEAYVRAYLRKKQSVLEQIALSQHSARHRALRGPCSALEPRGVPATAEGADHMGDGDGDDGEFAGAALRPRLARPQLIDAGGQAIGAPVIRPPKRPTGPALSPPPHSQRHQRQRDIAEASEEEEEEEGIRDVLTRRRCGQADAACGEDGVRDSSTHGAAALRPSKRQRPTPDQRWTAQHKTGGSGRPEVEPQQVLARQVQPRQSRSTVILDAGAVAAWGKLGQILRACGVAAASDHAGGAGWAAVEDGGLGRGTEDWQAVNLPERRLPPEVPADCHPVDCRGEVRTHGTTTSGTRDPELVDPAAALKPAAAVPAWDPATASTALGAAPTTQDSSLPADGTGSTEARCPGVDTHRTRNRRLPLSLVHRGMPRLATQPCATAAAMRSPSLAHVKSITAPSQVANGSTTEPRPDTQQCPEGRQVPSPMVRATGDGRRCLGVGGLAQAATPCRLPVRPTPGRSAQAVEGSLGYGLKGSPATAAAEQPGLRRAQGTPGTPCTRYQVPGAPGTQVTASHRPRSNGTGLEGAPECSMPGCDMAERDAFTTERAGAAVGWETVPPSRCLPRADGAVAEAEPTDNAEAASGIPATPPASHIDNGRDEEPILGTCLEGLVCSLQLVFTEPIGTQLDLAAAPPNPQEDLRDTLGMGHAALASIPPAPTPAGDVEGVRANAATASADATPLSVDGIVLVQASPLQHPKDGGPMGVRDGTLDSPLPGRMSQGIQTSQCLLEGWGMVQGLHRWDDHGREAAPLEHPPPPQPPGSPPPTLLPLSHSQLEKPPLGSESDRCAAPLDPGPLVERTSPVGTKDRSAALHVEQPPQATSAALEGGGAAPLEVPPAGVVVDEAVDVDQSYAELEVTALAAAPGADGSIRAASVTAPYPPEKDPTRTVAAPSRLYGRLSRGGVPLAAVRAWMGLACDPLVAPSLVQDELDVGHGTVGITSWPDVTMAVLTQLHTHTSGRAPASLVGQLPGAGTGIVDAAAADGGATWHSRWQDYWLPVCMPSQVRDVRELEGRLPMARDVLGHPPPAAPAGAAAPAAAVATLDVAMRMVAKNPSCVMVVDAVGGDADADRDAGTASPAPLQPERMGGGAAVVPDGGHIDTAQRTGEQFCSSKSPRQGQSAAVEAVGEGSVRPVATRGQSGVLTRAQAAVGTRAQAAVVTRAQAAVGTRAQAGVTTRAQAGVTTRAQAGIEESSAQRRAQMGADTRGAQARGAQMGANGRVGVEAAAGAEVGTELHSDVRTSMSQGLEFVLHSAPELFTQPLTQQF